MRTFLAVPLLVCSAAASGWADSGAIAHRGDAINNEGLVVLARAGYNEKFLLELIRTKDTKFDTSVEGLVYFAKQGLSERVVRAILEREKQTRQLDAADEAETPAAPTLRPVRMKVVKQNVLVPDEKGAELSPRHVIVVESGKGGNRYYAVPAAGGAWNVSAQ